MFRCCAHRRNPRPAAGRPARLAPIFHKTSFLDKSRKTRIGPDIDTGIAPDIGPKPVATALANTAHDLEEQRRQVVRLAGRVVEPVGEDVRVLVKDLHGDINRLLRLGIVSRLPAFHGASRNQLPRSTNGRPTVPVTMSACTQCSGMIPSPASVSATCSRIQTVARYIDAARNTRRCRSWPMNRFRSIVRA